MIGQLDRKRITVVGAGVIGLTTALVLSKQHDVRIVARESGPATNSRLATAIWHIYLVTTRESLSSDDPHLRWGEETLSKLIDISLKYVDSGVSSVEGVELFRHTEPENYPAWFEFAKRTMGLRHLTDGELLKFNAVEDLKISDDHKVLLRKSPVKWGYRLRAPVARMDRYLRWLEQQLFGRNVSFERRTIERFDEVASFSEIIVNCTGIGSRELLSDSSFTPYKGQYFVLAADMEAPEFYVGDDDHPLGMAYAIPRGGEVLIGGTAEANKDDLIPTIDVQEISERAGLYYPWIVEALGRQKIQTPIVGVRPVRSDGVRLEVDRSISSIPIIHNYGHGGSGFSLSWGCASAVLQIINNM
jgi:glycine/D-amino acid oxidase-like deaminating enzyme